MQNKVQQTAKEFYEANATNIVNVPLPNHPEDKSGWAGVRRASKAKFIDDDIPVMPLWDAFDFAEKYHASHAPAAQPQAQTGWISAEHCFEPFYDTKDSAGRCRGCKHYAESAEKFFAAEFHDADCFILKSFLALPSPPASQTEKEK